MEPDIYALSKAGLDREQIGEITGCNDKKAQMRNRNPEKRRNMMKRMISVFLLSLLLAFLMACSNGADTLPGDSGLADAALSQKNENSDSFFREDDEQMGDASIQENSNANTYEQKNGNHAADTSLQEEIPASGQEGQAESNILIVYFSRWGNTEYPDDVDASTSASIIAGDSGRQGTTEYVANLIQQTVGGDMHRIETVEPYTADFDELRDVNHEEMQQGILPELKESSLDMAGYDTVFIGYPNMEQGFNSVSCA